MGERRIVGTSGLSGKNATSVDIAALVASTPGAAFRVDVEPGDEPELAFYCRTCAEREFGDR